MAIVQAFRGLFLFELRLSCVVFDWPVIRHVNLSMYESSYDIDKGFLKIRFL